MVQDFRLDVAPLQVLALLGLGGGRGLSAARRAASVGAPGIAPHSGRAAAAAGIARRRIEITLPPGTWSAFSVTTWTFSNDRHTHHLLDGDELPGVAVLGEDDAPKAP